MASAPSSVDTTQLFNPLKAHTPALKALFAALQQTSNNVVMLAHNFQTLADRYNEHLLVMETPPEDAIKLPPRSRALDSPERSDPLFHSSQQPVNPFLQMGSVFVPLTRSGHGQGSGPQSASAASLTSLLIPAAADRSLLAHRALEALSEITLSVQASVPTAREQIQDNLVSLKDFYSGPAVLSTLANYPSFLALVQHMMRVEQWLQSAGAVLSLLSAFVATKICAEAVKTDAVMLQAEKQSGQDCSSSDKSSLDKPNPSFSAKVVAVNDSTPGSQGKAEATFANLDQLVLDLSQEARQLDLAVESLTSLYAQINTA